MSFIAWCCLDWNTLLNNAVSTLTKYEKKEEELEFLVVFFEKEKGKILLSLLPCSEKGVCTQIDFSFPDRLRDKTISSHKLIYKRSACTYCISLNSYLLCFR